MRTTAKCPKCSGEKFLVGELKSVDTRGESATEDHPLVPAMAYVAEAKGWLGGGRQKRGRFESWICTACGYTEFYANDLGDLDEIAAQKYEGLRVVDGTKARSPFR